MYLPLCKVPDTLFHIQGDDVATTWLIVFCLPAGRVQGVPKVRGPAEAAFPENPRHAGQGEGRHETPPRVGGAHHQGAAPRGRHQGSEGSERDGGRGPGGHPRVLTLTAGGARRRG